MIPHRISDVEVNVVAEDIGDDEPVAGHPIVFNEGEILFGNNVHLATEHEAVTLVTKPGGVIVLGDDVEIGSGSTIAAFGRVDIGTETRIGSFCRVLDDESAAGIRIGERVEIEDDVMVVAGAVIGSGARILRGALVTGRIREGEVVKRATDPLLFQSQRGAAIRSRIDDVHADSSGDTPLLHDVRDVVRGILPSASSAEPHATLSDWDSLTAVHLIVALEDRFGITIDDGALIDRHTLQALTDFVEEKLPAKLDASLPARRSSKPRVATAADAVAPAEADGVSGSADVPSEPSGRRSERITLEMKALGGAFSKTNLLIKLANLLPIWSLRHLRAYLLRSSGCRISEKCTFLGRVRFIGASPANLEVEDGTIIGPNVTFGVDGKIMLGRNVSIGPGVTIYTGTHDVGSAQRRMNPRVLAKPVTIEDGAWIGLNALILPGVRIGAGAIVSAGAVVSSDVPNNAVAAGNPAVVTRTIVA